MLMSLNVGRAASAAMPTVPASFSEVNHSGKRTAPDTVTMSIR